MSCRIKKYDSLKSILLLMVVFIGVYSFAQTKQHYVFHSANPNVDLTVYQNAIENWGKLDEFRLLDKRRKILFFDENKNEAVNIELFSAAELKQLYNKRIPYHLTAGEKIRKAIFILSPDKKSLIVKYLKK